MAKCTELFRHGPKINRAKARNSLTLCNESQLWRCCLKELNGRQRRELCNRGPGSPYLPARCRRRAALETWLYNSHSLDGTRTRKVWSTAELCRQLSTSRWRSSILRNGPVHIRGGRLRIAPLFLNNYKFLRVIDKIAALFNSSNLFY